MAKGNYEPVEQAKKPKKEKYTNKSAARVEEFGTVPQTETEPTSQQEKNEAEDPEQKEAEGKKTRIRTAGEKTETKQGRAEKEPDVKERISINMTAKAKASMDKWKKVYGYKMSSKFLNDLFGTLDSYKIPEYRQSRGLHKQNPEDAKDIKISLFCTEETRSQLSEAKRKSGLSITDLVNHILENLDEMLKNEI